MSLLSLSLPIPILHSSTQNFTSLRIVNPKNSSTFHFHKKLKLFIRASAVTVHRNFPVSREIVRRIAVSTIVFLSLGSTLFAFSAFASTQIHPRDTCVTQLQEEQESKGTGVEKSENVEDVDEELQAAFEKWKSKTYALTVPLRVVSLSDSFPPVWLKDFMRSQGKRVKLRSEFRQSLQDIFHELCIPLQKGKINAKSALAADVVTLGDTWLSYAIEKRLIEPMDGLEDQDWFENLSEKWKVYLRRSDEGKLDSNGKIWAAPYRWGSIVIAYKKSEFQKRKMAPIEDWADLWRPELAGRISMVDSPREIVGAVLRYMGASYNTMDMSEVAGGREAVQKNLASLVKQVRLFDSCHYLKAFGAGDVWVAVGWSNDVIPAAKRLSNIAVVVPNSGASLWADFWAIPAASRVATDQIGGRVRGPSPVVHQWIEFCLQAERFKGDVVPGASPNALESPIKVSEELTKGRPKLETNLIAGVPPSDILAKCELIEPLPENTLSEYRWLINSVQKPELSLAKSLRNRVVSLAHSFLPKVQSKVA
ncbi:putative ethanolamine-phosphate cytidylyltransferase-like isoform X1 [Capsicum annuum]|nr:putative ethanolamine-phosphate cytidylyltransferase-like isoform X1 [Capsicum annuum]